MTQKSAVQEAWWGEFAKEFGSTPLRELARRYDTNPRRLRRAAQRAGLSEEPAIVLENADALGKGPDLSLAAKLGVTVEAIKGARARRGIPPFDKATAPPKPVEEASVVLETKSTEAEPAVVVKRAPPPARDSTPGTGLPSGPGLGRLRNIAPSEPEVTVRPARRRRIVKKD